MSSTTWLIQVLLPLSDNDGTPFGEQPFAQTRGELLDRFGGLTAYRRSPAHGLWKSGEGVARDDVVIVEVMAGDLDRGWWNGYRRELERRFRQDAIVIRASTHEVL
jgi:hypothetical protein